MALVTKHHSETEKDLGVGERELKMAVLVFTKTFIWDAGKDQR